MSSPELSLLEAPWYEDLLKVGLYVGAVFQLICIAALIFVPKPEEAEVGGLGGSPLPGLADYFLFEGDEHTFHNQWAGRISSERREETSQV